MLTDVLLHLLDPAALGVVVGPGKGTAGKDAGILRPGQLVHHLEEAHILLKRLCLMGQRIQLGVYAHDGFQGKGEPQACPLKHLVNIVKDVFVHAGAVEQVLRKLDGDFPHIRRRTDALLPGVLQLLPRHQGEFILPYFFHAVSYHALYAGPVFNEVELKLHVGMERVQELALVPFHNVQAVFFRDGGNFP